MFLDRIKIFNLNQGQNRQNSDSNKRNKRKKFFSLILSSANIVKKIIPERKFIENYLLVTI